MGLFTRKKQPTMVAKYELITDRGQGHFNYNGGLYKSDLIRACIRPKAQAIGKAIGKHIRDNGEELTINPEPYMRFLLEEPNPYMTGQMLQEKLIWQLMLNNNAFAFIQRDESGLPVAIYPLDADAVEAKKSQTGELYLKFTIRGKDYTFSYKDIIHLRRDFNKNELFGDSAAPALLPLMEIVATTDQGLIKAIKNSNTVRWLLKYLVPLQDEDLKKNVKRFVENFLQSQEDDVVGAAAVDTKVEATQVEPKDYVPNAAVMDRTHRRVFSYYNTNEAIITSSYSENQWVSYYEAEIERDLKQMAGEWTRKMFTRKARGFGNKIVFEANDLTYASMGTKLGLVAFVDRGIMSPDEVRRAFNYAPVPGGEGKLFLRRLDTAPVKLATPEEGGEEDA